MHTTFPRPTPGSYFRRLVVYDTESYKDLSPRKVEMLCRFSRRFLPKLESLTLLVPSADYIRQITPLVNLPRQVTVNLFPNASNDYEDRVVWSLNEVLKGCRRVKEERQDLREKIEKADVLAWSLKKTLKLRA